MPWQLKIWERFFFARDGECSLYGGFVDPWMCELEFVCPDSSVVHSIFVEPDGWMKEGLSTESFAE